MTYAINVKCYEVKTTAKSAFYVASKSYGDVEKLVNENVALESIIEIKLLGDFFCFELASDNNKYSLDLVGTKIIHTELSPRAKNCLSAEGLHTLYDITKTTKRKLGSIPNLGKVTVNEISDYLRKIGVKMNCEERVLFREVNNDKN